MEYLKRQEKLESKKKQSAKSVYTSKHVRMVEAIREKNRQKGAGK